MEIDMGGFLTFNLLIAMVGLVILYRGYCRRYVNYKERQALIDFFDRLENKGINPREFILPPERIYIADEDGRAVENKAAFKKSTLISILAMFLLILLSALTVYSDPFTSYFLFPGVHVLIIYPIGRYRRRRQRRELKDLRYRRQYLLNKFVFSLNVSEYFTIYDDEDEESSEAQLGFVDPQC